MTKETKDEKNSAYFELVNTVVQTMAFAFCISTAWVLVQWKDAYQLTKIAMVGVWLWKLFTLMDSMEEFCNENYIDTADES